MVSTRQANSKVSRRYDIQLHSIHVSVCNNIVTSAVHELRLPGSREPLYRQGTHGRNRLQNYVQSDRFQASR